MRGVFRFSTDLSPGAGKYTEKSAAATRSKLVREHVENPQRMEIIRRSRGGVGNAYVTLSPLTAIDSTYAHNWVIISPITTFIALSGFMGTRIHDVA